MTTRRLAARLVEAVVCLVTALLVSGTAAAAAPAAATDLGNASCLSCHDGKRKGKLEVPTGEGEKKRTLHAVDPAKFGAGVHAAMECVTCHREINDSTAPHRKAEGESRPDCAQCHAELANTLAKFKTAGERRGLRTVVDNISAYKASSHAQPSENNPKKPQASCNDCHDVHDFNVPAPGTPARAQWRLSVSDRCGACHDAHLDEWGDSVHGRAVKEKHDAKSANCVDCHTAHNISKPTTGAAKLAITDRCGNCHEDAYKTYRTTYHGQITTLGFTYTAKCVDCHGSHDLEPSKNPKAKTSINNRLKTCQKCHSGKKDIPLATAGFVSFSPHGRTDDFANNPQIWVANKVMVNLLLGTFGFFWLHTLLWFYREYRERRQRGQQPHVRMEGIAEIPPQFQGKHFMRFSRTWRAAHLVFALTLMILTLTGISLFYPEAPWARTLINALGGPRTAGIIHRTMAVIFAAVFLGHLGVVLTKIVRHRKEFQVFGPNSLIPGIQDMKDIVAMFRWFLGLGPRPKFDRWTYWEKFDYWAPFWGVAIIGVSGLMLWVPHITARFLPGWVFNVATIFHSEEAFLAVVFLFTVHFFNNHFRPDKFPLDVVMFTGTFTLEEFRHEHPLQYQRLLESGELDRHIVNAPPRTLSTASRILGFTLIVCGLTLLTLVAIGFSTSL